MHFGESQWKTPLPWLLQYSKILNKKFMKQKSNSKQIDLKISNLNFSFIGLVTSNPSTSQS
jgi:hypothetical protein